MSRPTYTHRRTNGVPATAPESSVNPLATRAAALEVLGGADAVAKLAARTQGTNVDLVLMAKLRSNAPRSSASRRLLKGQVRRNRVLLGRVA